MAAAAMAMDAKMAELVKGLAKKITLEPGQLLYLPPLVVVWERCEAAATFVHYKWVPAAVDDMCATIKKVFQLDGWPQNEALSRCRANMQIVADAWGVKE
eukprot:s887_g18.t1